MRAVMAGQPRVSQAMCGRKERGFCGREGRTKGVVAGFVLEGLARDLATERRLSMIELSSS
jgi:hypothetical protein